ncbi:phage tail protein [Pseudomonas sp. RIT-PI-AD]|uniref:phage tail protein n=1 Tax=Pseudomonas sp. RIT-PI-AD TaxID=3035294 RepID=UPI0021D93B84|nr:phage tail protein [Pseudomonas sp. RIT-PI-AD]
MAVETFTWPVAAGVQGEIEYAVRETKYGDGYAQVVGDGLNDRSESWAVSKTGNRSTMQPLWQFLDRHAGRKAFRWVTPTGTSGFFRAKGYRLTPLGNELFTLSATFEQHFHP